MRNDFETSVIVIKAAGSGFSFTVCLIALLYLLYCKLYSKLLHRLILLLLVSSCLFTFSVLFEAIAVNATNQVKGNDLDGTIGQTLCTISGALLHYSTWVDVLTITAIAVWLCRITNKTNRFSTPLDKVEYKKRIRQKHWEVMGVVVVLLLPIAAIVPPLAMGRYEENEGMWCRLQLRSDDDATAFNNTDFHIKSLAVALALWYIPVFLVMIILTIILTVANTRLLRKLRSSSKILRDSHTNVLKDGIYLSIFLMVIYAVYGINLLTTFYYQLSPRPETTLWIIEALATTIRGVAILCMFFNHRICRKVVTNKKNRESNTHQLLQNMFDNSYHSPGLESLLTTPSIISSNEYANEPDGEVEQPKYHTSVKWQPVTVDPHLTLINTM